jgi:hypothetical protein
MFTDLLARVRRDFYSGPRAPLWHAQQKMIKKALMHPARCLNKLGVQIPADRYEGIFDDILGTMFGLFGLIRFR